MSETLELRVDTGAILIDIKNEKGRKIGEFEFIPTDLNIIRRYEAVVDHINSLQIDKGLDENGQVKKFLELSDDIEKQVDYLLGGEASKAVFRECAPFTVLKNGDFYIENVLTGIDKLIEKVMHQRVQKKLLKLRKATGKYHA